MTSEARDWKVDLAEADPHDDKGDWWRISSGTLDIDLEVQDWPSQQGVPFKDGEELAAHVVKDLLNRALSAQEWAGLALDISRYAHEEDDAEAYGHTGGFCHACHVIQKATEAVVTAGPPWTEE